ncbi:MAG: CaiB/BaiF CoA transferase family protein [Magnetospirillum sp.]
MMRETSSPAGAAMPAKGPLHGVRILDFSRILSGPYATMILADFGAEVIKVENTDKGDETRGFPPFVGDMSHYFIALNRNKQSLALDLKSPQGRDIARKLAALSDVVVENFRPGVMKRLGLDHQTLAADNPALCYCSISGFGQDSPLADRPAFDIVAQALSGVMSVNGEPGQPPSKLGLPLGDMAASIYAVFAILAVLFERQSTGKGRHIEVPMLDSLMGMLGYLAQVYFVTGNAPRPVGTKHPNIVPYGAFPTSDGHVIVACLTERFWVNFARALDLPELVQDPRFGAYEDRLRNRDQLEEMVESRMRQNDTAFWLARLDECDVPNAPIMDVGQALNQAHVSQAGLVETVHHPAVGDLRVVGSPVRLDGERPATYRPPPLLGEHSKDVLQRLLDIGPQDAEALQQGGVIS